jgi:2,3-bisphosphoglycerate-dependent phosphoglycerate mutase
MKDPAAVPLLTRTFYFVRHGETESNLQGTIAGSVDTPLTDRGHAQARTVAAALKNDGITAIYCSALRRSRDTARHIASALALPVSVIPELGERNWGELEGAPRDMRVRGVTPRGAETPEEFVRRVQQGLAKISGEGVPLVVAHSGVFRVLCRTLDIAESDGPIANCQPIRFVPPDALHAAWRLELL